MELNNFEIKESSSLDLIEYIGWKDEYPKEAESAFVEFCYRFDEYVLKSSDIICSKRGYNEVIALDISNCTFQKVWKYPTYNHTLSNTSDIDKGIKLWLHKIVFTQYLNYNKDGHCYKPDNETDLSLIYSFDELYDTVQIPENKRRELAKREKVIDEALSRLTPKHKTIYLTYKAYAPDLTKNIPRSVSKLLQEQLGLATGSIRKYKQEANQIVTSYLNSINE